MSSGSSGRSKKKSIGFRFAWNGIQEVCRTERNFRIHLTAVAVVVTAGILLGLSPLEWAVIVLICSLVMALEMVNSSIERIMDYLAPEKHPMAGLIKDMAAGAVLVASIGAVLIAFFLLLPKIVDLLS
ncbi:diacylglycerol kinase family protein [Halobacillus litoralis]|uniref:diacylglycerol kinase family protein n=1 Tax=Halobacillus litoralis TaxID=45668 RepID=UPI001CD58696|nr:diacylglycerol kinase family protein [Halobacillus litoralis]MCA0970044.1 diacylglycerol kinase family protein [Halobacillus litoralis]